MKHNNTFSQQGINYCTVLIILHVSIIVHYCIKFTLQKLIELYWIPSFYNILFYLKKFSQNKFNFSCINRCGAEPVFWFLQWREISHHVEWMEDDKKVQNACGFFTPGAFNSWWAGCQKWFTDFVQHSRWYCSFNSVFLTASLKFSVETFSRILLLILVDHDSWK